MPDKNNNETKKRARIPDTEYPQNPNPAMDTANEAIGRSGLSTSNANFGEDKTNLFDSEVQEAGYGKSMDLELAEIGQDQNKNEAENYSPGWNTENAAEVNPETNMVTSDEAGNNQNFESIEMENPANQRNSLKNIADKGATEFAGELTGITTDDLNQTGNQPEFNFEFGDFDKKTQLPTGKSRNNKNRV